MKKRIATVLELAESAGVTRSGRDPNEHGFASDLDAACAVRDVLGRC